MFGLFKKSKKPPEPESLLECTNPHGTLLAEVESDGETVYLYLHDLRDLDELRAKEQESSFGTRYVWVRNLVEAPVAIDGDRIKAGLAPLNPHEYCRSGAKQPLPAPSDLRLVWLPEGNGVGLYEDDRLLAIIPPWSGQDGFNGYSAEASGFGPCAWELEPNNLLIERFRQAEAYWRTWETSSVWNDAQDGFLADYEQALGEHDAYCAIDSGKWPPKAILFIPGDGWVALVTAGVSLVPQPNVEAYKENYEQFRRIELGVVLPKTWPDEEIKAFASYLSGQTEVPWNRFIWFGVNHTITCDRWRNPDFSAAIMLLEHPALPPVPLRDQFGEPTNLLWLVPISDKERLLAMNFGSKSLVEILPPDRWREA